MAYRVVTWGTGNVGRYAVRAVLHHPELELVSHVVSSPDKAGRDELSRLLLGTRVSLGIGLVAVLLLAAAWMPLKSENLTDQYGSAIMLFILRIRTRVLSGNIA